MHLLAVVIGLAQAFALLRVVTCIRMIKVVVPSYELFGNSALLECQYQLVGHEPQQQLLPQPKTRPNYQQQQYQRHAARPTASAGAGDNFNINDDSDSDNDNNNDDVVVSHRRLPQPLALMQQQQPRQQYQQQQQQQQSRPFYPQSSPSSSSSFLPAHDQQPYQQTYGGTEQRHQQQQQPHDDEQDSREDVDAASSNGNSGNNGGVLVLKEMLYSVKWYKDNEEFYRYVPKANPPQHSYRIDGIRVDHEGSNNVRVKLKRVTLKSSGMYRCEVSAEAPNFSSDHGEGRMEVLFLPREGPQITGDGVKRQYQIGETLQLNCTSGKSHPAPHLEWLINNKPLAPELVTHFDDVVHSHGLITSVIGLKLPLRPHHFNNGEVHVRCVASVSPVLWKGGMESILQRRPASHYENREAMLLVRSSSSRMMASQLSITLVLLCCCGTVTMFGS